MADARVTSGKEVSVNGVNYRIRGGVQQFIASAWPPKQVLGDFTMDTHPFVSGQEWNDHRSGIGKDVYEAQDPGRAWWSTLSMRHRGHLPLQKRTVQTASSTTSAEVGFINEIGNEIYASFGLYIERYDNSGDAWTAGVRTLASAATDSIKAPVGGTETLAVATGGSLDYTTTGQNGEWNRTAIGQPNIKYLAHWRDYLWGIATDGSLYFTNDLGAGWTLDAKLPLSSGSITKLLVAPSPDPSVNRTIIYAATTHGLFVHDAENSQFIETDLQVPSHAQNGRGAEAFRGAIYFPAGHSVYEYRPGPQTLVRLIGPDRDDGLPSDRRGPITTMAKTHNDLLVGTNPATGSGQALTAYYGTHSVTQFHQLIPADSGIPSILGWGGGQPPLGLGGWEVKWASGTAGDAVDVIYVSHSAYNTYRAWWSSGGRVFYQQLPTDIVNPQQVSTQEYESSGSWDSPWFDATVSNQDKLALEARIETRNPTSSDTVTVYYATNRAESFTALGSTLSSADEHVLAFPNSTTPTGTSFRDIRLRVVSARGGTVTNTPDVTKLSLVYLRQYAFLLGFRITLDLTKDFRGLTTRELRDKLDTLLSARQQVEFTYRDDAGTDRNYYVIPRPEESNGFDRGTGRDETGLYQLTVVEAR